MNHLGHLLLARVAGMDPVATLLGDFVKGRLEERFEGRRLAGVRFHRTVDRFTDDHALHLRSRNRIPPPRRRYAGVLIDVFYDHYLARHWGQFSDEALEHFAERVYAAFHAERADLPERLQQFGDYMAKERLLTGYGELSTVERVVRQMSFRLSRPNPLASAAGELSRHYAALEQDFLTFFPDAIDFARSHRPT